MSKPAIAAISIIVFFAVLLNGCAQTLSVSAVQDALKSCEPHGGLALVWPQVPASSTKYEAQCKDGAHILSEGRP